MTTTTRPVPPTPLAANRNFSLLWGGEGVSVLGAMTTSAALPLLAVTTFAAGPGWMGLITAAAWLPWLVLGLPAGAWVDRSEHRRVMIAADLVGAAALASVPVAHLLGVLTLPHLVASALVNGVTAVFFRTAYTSLLPRVVDGCDLPVANGRIYGTEATAQVAGPGAGGLLVQLVGGASAMGVGAVGLLVSAGCLVRMDRRAIRPRAPRVAHTSLRTEVADGARITLADPYLRFFAVQGGLSNLGLTGMSTLLVLFLVRDLGLDPARVGLVMAVAATGGLLGAAVASRVAARLGTGRALLLLVLVSGPPAVVVPLARPGWGVAVVAVGQLVVALGVVGANVVRSAFRQRYVPADLLGRVTGATAVVNHGTMPLAGLAAGGLGGVLPLRGALLVFAGVHLLATVRSLTGPYAHRRDLPEAMPTTRP